MSDWRVFRRFCAALVLGAALALPGLPALGEEPPPRYPACPPAPKVTGLAYSLRSDTVLRALERPDRKDGEDRLILPAYEYLSADAEAGSSGFSIHLLGWGRKDLAGADHFKESEDGELLHGYVEYGQDQGYFRIRGGRQNILAAGANENVDGVRLLASPLAWLDLDVYGGLPVSVERLDGVDGDSVYGGRLGFRPLSRTVLGLSFKELADDGENARREAGLDFAVPLPARAEIRGQGTYNLKREGMSGHLLESLVPLGSFSLRPFWERYELTNLFDTVADSAKPFSFLALEDDTLTGAGLEAGFLSLPLWEGAVKLTRHDREESGETSWHGLARLTARPWESSRMGLEAGRLDAPDGVGYTLGRVFTWWKLSKGYVSGEGMVAVFDQEIYGRKESWHVLLSSGRDLPKALSLSLSAEYRQTPYFDSDVRATLLLTFRGGK